MSFLGIIPKVSQTKFYQIQITKSKVIHVKIPLPKWKKTRNGAKRGLKIEAGFSDYKSGQL